MYNIKMGENDREKMHPDLRSFLMSHRCEGDNKPTHTRIGIKLVFVEVNTIYLLKKRMSFQHTIIMR